MGLQLRIEISARISVNFQFQARPQCSSPLIRYVGANKFECSDQGWSTLKGVWPSFLVWRSPWLYASLAENKTNFDKYIYIVSSDAIYEYPQHSFGSDIRDKNTDNMTAGSRALL